MNATILAIVHALSSCTLFSSSNSTLPLLSYDLETEAPSVVTQQSSHLCRSFKATYFYRDQLHLDNLTSRDRFTRLLKLMHKVNRRALDLESFALWLNTVALTLRRIVYIASRQVYLKVDMPILIFIFATFNWLTLTS